MPPVFGTGVAVEDPLEVLGRLHRVGRDAVGDHEQRHLGTVEVLLDHDPLADQRRGRPRPRAVVGHDDALACGETVVLDDVRRAELVERRGRLVRRRADERAGGRDTGGGHHLLGEGLGPLELGGRTGRPEHGDTPLAHGVRDAGDQRGLRPDDDEVDPQAGGQVGDLGPVHRVDLVQPCDGSDPRVPGRRVHLADRRIPGEGPGQCVLATAGSDDEDLHVAGA